MEKTHWKKLTNPNYLGAYSLMDGEKCNDLTVTIEKVVIEKVTGEANKISDCMVAHLKGHKPMILNRTNCKTITKMYGAFIEDWANKKITVYVSKTRAFGETVDALRIRDVVILEQLTPQHKKWEGAKKSIADKQVTIEQIKQNYSLTAENEILLCK